MDLTQLVGVKLESAGGDEVGEVLGFEYYNGKLTLTVFLDGDFIYIDDDPDPGEEEDIPEEPEEDNILTLPNLVSSNA
jgi:hypothetical protein